MKKIFFFMLALLPTMAWADVEIDETNFPDEKFRSYLLSQSYGKDGVLTDDEIAVIQFIDVSEMGIRSLKGIEFFKALTMLYCHGNQLTTLDVSQNTELDWLDCYGNQLTILDVSQNTKLQYLACDYNQLSTLDVSRNTELLALSCPGNKLTTLDLSQNTELGYLLCYGNQLTALDISQDTLLIELYCYDNQLTTLEVSQNSVLTHLFCYGNRIKGAGMDALVESLPTVFSGLLYVIRNENEGNEMTTTQVAAAKAKGWIPLFFDGIEYTGSVPDGIDSPKFSPEGKDTIYNLGGQRIGGMAKGLNIVDRRKVMVK